MNDTERASVAALLRKGEAIAAVARVTGFSRNKIREVAVEIDVPIRSRADRVELTGTMERTPSVAGRAKTPSVSVLVPEGTHVVAVDYFDLDIGRIVLRIDPAKYEANRPRFLDRAVTKGSGRG